MKILINKRNPQIRITAPEIKFEEIEELPIEEIEELPHDYCAFFSKKDWTLVEEEPEKHTSKYLPDYDIEKMSKELAKLITDQFIEKGKRCEQQAVEDNDQENHIFWDGFRNCAENILRSVKELAELGRKGGSK